MDEPDKTRFTLSEFSHIWQMTMAACTARGQDPLDPRVDVGTLLLASASAYAGWRDTIASPDGLGRRHGGHIWRLHQEGDELVLEVPIIDGEPMSLIPASILKNLEPQR